MRMEAVLVYLLHNQQILHWDKVPHKKFLYLVKNLHLFFLALGVRKLTKKGGDAFIHR